MATSATRLASFLKQLPLWCHNRLAGMRALDELGRSPHAEVLRTARDFGITVQGLKRAAARGPLSGQLMARMVRAYGLEPSALRHADLNLVREMEGHCTFCGNRLRCSLDLADTDGVARAQAYCPNAETLTSIASGLALKHKEG